MLFAAMLTMRVHMRVGSGVRKNAAAECATAAYARRTC